MRSVELFIALRYLRSRSKNRFISVITWLSLCGIAAGVAILIIVTSVMNGLGAEVKERYVSSDSHIKVYSYHQKPFEVIDSVKTVIESQENVKAYAPYIEMYGLLKGDDNQGALIRGVELSSIKNVTKLDSQIVGGSYTLDDNGTGIPGIILGKNLADMMAAIVGEKIFIISPSIKNTFTAPPVLKFVVTGIFETGLSAIDGGLCYISTKSAQKLFRMKGKVNRISLIVDNPDNATSISNVINDKLPFPYLTRSWIEENKNLYFWIAMEKLMMTFVLSLIVLIAAFNIISSLIMLVMEKRREIGVLTAVGFSPDKVMRVFMYQGMILGVIGTVLGVILGLLVCFIQKEFSIITLPGDVYIIDALPILVDSTDVLVSVAVSMGLSYLATLYPSYRASKLKPVDVIRND